MDRVSYSRGEIIIDTESTIDMDSCNAGAEPFSKRVVHLP